MTSTTPRQPEWRFPPQIAGYMAQEPIQREFFTSENMGGLTRALVRESVQNALDARKKKPVGIRFAIIELGPDAYQEYLRGLLPHLEVIGTQYVTPPNIQAPMQFLIVEDFNTTGLEGDPEITFQKDPKPEENFYYFWHNVGRTGKSGAERGSWGLGKTVFPAVSSISTFFGLTCRTSDKRRMLMGQSVLRYHEIEAGKPITPYGYFGTYEPNEKKRWFALPIEDETVINRFCKTFRLMRKPDRPGLSLVIPAPNEAIRIDQLLLQAFQEYFYPILIGDLVVRVEKQHPSRKERDVVNQDNLIDTINKFSEEEFDEYTDFDKAAFLRLLDFMSWSLALPDTEIMRIVPPNTNVPDWNKYDVESTINVAQQRFEIDQRVAFRVDVPVKLAKAKGQRKDAEIGWFHVYLERDEQLRSAESYFLRSGIWVKEVKGHSLRGIRGIVIIDGADNPLVRLLASAENPAHTEWQRQSNALKAYTGGEGTLRFVRQSLAKLGGMLTQRDKEVDQDLLRDVFFVERPPEQRGRQAQSGGGKVQKAGDEGLAGFPDIDGRAQAVTMQPITDGVEIRGTDGSAPGRVVRVEFAYAIRRGNAFQKYDPLDFDLKQMPIEADGVELDLRTENRLHFVVRQPDFRVRVRGFDSLRDVEMRVQAVEGNQDGGDEGDEAAP
ncbi:MAG: hypothetical protein GYB67_08250 [Chloroflexi bacterium]|nr:hypothetical protein [Chloroflexota bacterium]